MTDLHLRCSCWSQVFRCLPQCQQRHRRANGTHRSRWMHTRCDHQPTAGRHDSARQATASANLIELSIILKKKKPTSEFSTTVEVLLTARQVPPLSVSVMRMMPDPCWTTSSAPFWSKVRLRGSFKSVATSWAVHPEPTTGALYEGLRTVGQAPAAEVVVDWAEQRVVFPNRAAKAASRLIGFMAVTSRDGWGERNSMPAC